MNAHFLIFVVHIKYCIRFLSENVVETSRNTVCVMNVSIHGFYKKINAD